MTDWHSVWSSRQGQSQTLADLINLDGFDAGAGKVTEEDWIEFVVCVARAANYGSGAPRGESLIELGCGAGAFLYPLQRSYPEMTLTGLDYSSPLLSHAQRNLPEATFIHSDLRQPLPDLPPQNHVLMHCVLHYLPTDRARRLLECAFALARESIALLGVPDKAFEHESEKARSEARPQGEYAELYRELSHTYYPKSFFESAMPQGWEIEWLDCRLKDANAPYRYSLIFRKTENS